MAIGFQRFSGEMFNSINPATGAVLALIANGGPRGCESRGRRRPVKRLRVPWSRFKPHERQETLLRLADLVDIHFDELGLSRHSPTWGGPIKRNLGPCDAASWGCCAITPVWRTTIHGEGRSKNLYSGRLSDLHRKGAGWRRRCNHSLEWSRLKSLCLGKLGPVLATGCTVVLKPAEEASPGTRCALRNCAWKRACPPGVR